MNDLKKKLVGGRQVVLAKVPARDARKMQMHLAALLSEPLSKALPQEIDGQAIKVADQKLAQMVKGLTIGAGALSSLFASLDDGEMDKLIDQAARFVFIDGKPMDENEHFTADTLLDLYEVLWFFYSETFGGFFGAIRSRFPQIESLKALIQSKAQTLTGTAGVPA